MTKQWRRRKIVPMPKGKMTLEKLARMVQKGFAYVDERLASLDTRLTKLEDRATAIELRVTAIERRLREIEGELRIMRRQLAKAVYYPECAALEQRISRLELQIKIRPR